MYTQTHIFLVTTLNTSTTTKYNTHTHIFQVSTVPT